MKSISIRSALLFSVLALGVVSCGKETKPDAAQSLEQSYQAAEPEVKQAITTVHTSLKAGNYAEATRALTPVIQKPMTDAQRQAIGLTLEQINKAVAENPNLDTKEMYDLRAKMFKAVHSGPRF